MELLVQNYLEKFTVESFDINRPWGGFFCIDKKDVKLFVYQYFKINIDISRPLSPKILIINPGKRISWQYHCRRKEIWIVLEGPVGVMKSPSNDETSVIIHQKDDMIFIDKEERHRLIGLENHGIVAEIWDHVDPNNLSNENDIIRVQDDFHR